MAFCEISPFCRRVLNKHWPGVPTYEDVRSLSFPEGFADVVCGGFPCQDISIAGKRAGITGERSGLWKYMVDTIRMVQPQYVIMENVADLLGNGLGGVLGDLAEISYDAEWYCIPASAFGAPHERDRWWGIAYPQSFGLSGRRNGWQEALADELTRLGERKLRGWREEPMPVGVDDGASHRVDRIRSLGNAVVPQIPELIGRAILKAEGLSP